MGPATQHIAFRGGRGRHGHALQWHLGLEVHDGSAELDWENRIEIKMVSVWRRGERVVCDKLKVCDAGVDPWQKLSNVAWFFVDRVTRTIVGHHFSTLGAEPLALLAQSWGADPHFERPMLFVEARDAADGSSAPAYYLAADFFERAGWLPARGVTPFDSKAWSELRRDHGRRDPQISLASPGVGTPLACPRCEGPIHFDERLLAERGAVAGRHALPCKEACALRGHWVVDPAPLVAPRGCTRSEQYAGIEGRVPLEELWRLADRVFEPEDHEH